MTIRKAERRQTAHVGGLETRRIVRDVVPLELDMTDDYGEPKTVGQLIDERIAECLRVGDELQQVTFHFDHESPDAVRNLCDLYGVK